MNINKHYILPCSCEQKTEDPLSIVDVLKYKLKEDIMEIPKWLFIENIFMELKNNLKIINNNEEKINVLIDTIETITYSFYKKTIKADLLKKYLNQFLPNIIKLDVLFDDIIPSMINLGIRMPELFPNNILDILYLFEDEKNMTSIKINEKQNACLLVHMFFNTLKKPNWNNWWSGFYIWYENNDSTNENIIYSYLTTLFLYFQKLNTFNESDDIVFIRRKLHNMNIPAWNISSVQIISSEKIKIENEIILKNNSNYYNSLDYAQIVF